MVHTTPNFSFFAWQPGIIEKSQIASFFPGQFSKAFDQGFVGHLCILVISVKLPSVKLVGGHTLHASW